MRRRTVLAAVAVAVSGALLVPGVSGALPGAGVADATALGPRDCPARGPDPLTLTHRTTRGSFTTNIGSERDVTVTLRSGNDRNGIQYAWAVLYNARPDDILVFETYWTGTYPTECARRTVTGSGVVRTGSFRTSSSSKVTFRAVAYVVGFGGYHEVGTKRW